MDNHHVSLSGSPASCAILEASGLTSDQKKVLYAIATRLYHPSRGSPQAVLLWSDILVAPIDGKSNGQALVAYIQDKIGGYIYTNEGDHFIENPLTGNRIAVWMWIIPHEQFKKWYITERVDRARRV